ncbi:hypothetical protein ACOMHN_023267 [Nucella lapillus]
MSDIFYLGCPVGYGGSWCQAVKLFGCKAAGNTYLNGGTCVNVSSGQEPFCRCPSTHYGARCQSSCLPCPKFHSDLPSLSYIYEDWENRNMIYKCNNNGTLTHERKNPVFQA